MAQSTVRLIVDAQNAISPLKRVNDATKNLSKNTDKVGKFFDTITKNWKLIAGLVVGGIILKTVADLYLLFKSIRGLASALGLGRVFGGKRTTGGSGSVTTGHDTKGLGKVGKPWWDTTKGRTALSKLNDSNSRILHSLEKPLSVNSILSKLKDFIGRLS